MAPAPVIPWFL
uniref:Uncharacterized protein n=1 Tax=Moniliophthora roreri TaxID=221103 RepID=A0A0W0GDH8_MONRR